MTTKVTLHGKLRQLYGTSFTFDICCVTEAFTALCSQISGFRQYVSDKYYKVFVDDDVQISEHEIYAQRSMRTIDVYPAIAGSGSNGLLGIITGAALIGASFIPGLQFASPFLFKAGIGLALGGAAALLAPKPSAPNYQSQQVDGNSSALFDGPKARSAEGVAVPYCFGEVEVGGNLISSVLKVSDTVVV